MNYLPCPFCGKKPEISRHPGNFGKDFRCFEHTEFMTMEEWNKRCDNMETINE